MNGIPVVDLVVLIDSSESMKDLADTLSKVVGTATRAARMKHRASLRVTYLSTEAAFPHTVFMIPARGYLTAALNVDGSLLRSRPRGQRTGPQGQRSTGIEGNAGHAILDVVTHFDWRPGATRNLLFLGDGPLDGARALTPTGQGVDIGAASRVIEIARHAGARVHMCAGAVRARVGAGTPARRRAAIEAEYARVAVETGGRSVVAQDGVGACLAMLENVTETIMTDPRLATTMSMTG
ncbi:hypothetical protein WME89_21980 [Sorangium sp. So ce321]|uniref:hypothetical protein n=1 Tax=Sorangium sp. So ce321 TaxID=3133300 RepID=UPI003F61C834